MEILIKKIQEKKKIRIIGDYDIDGVMATYILLKGLEGVGAEVNHVIPNRMKDGYGLNEHLIQQAWEDGIDTIITCDNGIAAGSQIQKGKELGMTILVTDHHEVPFRETEKGRGRNTSPCGRSGKSKTEGVCVSISGNLWATVALKVVEALYRKQQPKTDITDQLLEYAGIATIGDVMELKGENRILVKEGLKRLHHTSNLGLQELCRGESTGTGRISRRTILDLCWVPA